LLIYADSTQHTKLEGETSAGKLNGHSGRKREDEKAQAVNCRTGVRYPHQLYGITKNMDKGIKKCKQIYAGGRHCLQSQKMVELPGAKTKNSSDGDEKACKRSLFLFFSGVLF
jgi:hypothetical protein